MIPTVFAVSVLASLLITPGVIRVASARSLYDPPVGGRHVHTSPVPRLGGVGVFLATLLGLGAGVVSTGGRLLLQPDLDRFLMAVLLGGGVLFGIGMVDDLRGVSPRAKMAGQAVAGVIFWFAGLRLETLIFGPELGEALGWVSLPLTVVWVVVVTNAFNLIDGLDGLATGIALVALSSAMAVSVLLHRDEVLMVSTALLGALIGFFRYNFRPARIFLGDCGSLFVGCMLAMLSVYGIESGASATLGVAPIFALAIPLIDTILSFSRRWLRGVSFATADRRHLHHQLLARGLTHLRAVIVLNVVAISLAAFGLVVAFAPPTVTNVAVVGGGLLSVLLLLWTLGYLGYHEFSEAYAVVTWAPRRIRKVIRDQIHSRDLAQVLAVAGSLEEVNAVLADNAADFGFLDMTVVAEGEGPRIRPIVIDNGVVMHPPRFEYPVSGVEHAGAPEYVLRIWCRPGLSRPHGAERVAGILAPVIRDWLAKRDSVGIATLAAAPEVGMVVPRA